MRIANKKGALRPFFVVGQAFDAEPLPRLPHSDLQPGIPMFNRVLTSVFGSRNDRLLRQLSGIVKKINALEPRMQALSDDELQA
jgi:preprotein translocase subunit SecA